MTNPLVFITACQCAGSGCGGHVPVAQEKWQAEIPVSMALLPDLFVAQHTYTLACDGFHEPRQCPRTEVKP